MSAPRHPGGDAQRSGSSGAAALRGAVLLTAAVVLGVVLLHNADGTGAPVSARDTNPASPSRSSGGGGSRGATDTSVPTTELVTTSSVPTISQLRDPATVKVLVANASGRSRAAARVSGVLQRAGYTDQVAPGNARTNGLQSQVYAASGFEAEATAIASLLSMAPTAVAPLSSSVPVADQGGAQIVVIVGVDVATRFQDEPLPTTTGVSKP